MLGSAETDRFALVGAFSRPDRTGYLHLIFVLAVSAYYYGHCLCVALLRCALINSLVRATQRSVSNKTMTQTPNRDRNSFSQRVTRLVGATTWAHQVWVLGLQSSGRVFGQRLRTQRRGHIISFVHSGLTLASNRATRQRATQKILPKHSLLVCLRDQTRGSRNLLLAS